MLIINTLIAVLATFPAAAKECKLSGSCGVTRSMVSRRNMGLNAGPTYNWKTEAKVTTITPPRPTFKEQCDFLVNNCLRAYRTDFLCARTLFYAYKDFSNYCLMDYANCMERYEIWQIAHMGSCYTIKVNARYEHDPGTLNDDFMDQIVLLDEK